MADRVCSGELTYPLHRIDYLPGPKLWVGDCFAGRLLVWSHTSELVKALYTGIDGALVDLGDSALVVGSRPDLSDFDPMFARGTTHIPICAYDLVSGILRWRRWERSVGPLRVGTIAERTVVEIGATHGVIQLDAHIGVRVRNALFAAASPWLRQRWQLDLAKLSALQREAHDRGAPLGVTVFGRLAEGELLCAQPTELGCRVGVYHNTVYTGPFPLATAISQALWARAERDSSRDASDEVCRRVRELWS